MNTRAVFVLFAILGLLCHALPCQAQEQSGQSGDSLTKLLEKDYKPDEPIFPADVVKNPEYLELDQEPIGSIDFVENEAYVIHPGEPQVARKAQKSKPVYQNDTLITDASSRLVVLLKDKSQLTMAASSRLSLESLSYDEASQARDTNLNLAVGKARFVVSKLITGNQENFKISTPLAVIGVRGSDFVVGILPENEVPGRNTSFLDFLIRPAYAAPAPKALILLTGENTSVSLRSPFGPPMVVNSFQVTAAFRNMPPLPPMPVSPGLVPGVMNRVGPSVSVMSMPSVFE